MNSLLQEVWDSCVEFGEEHQWCDPSGSNAVVAILTPTGIHIQWNHTVSRETKVICIVSQYGGQIVWDPWA